MRILRISDEVRASFDPILKALGPVRQELAAVQGVAVIRPGYFLPPTSDPPLPAVVVAMMPDAPRDAVDAYALAHKFGVPITVIDATPEEQMAALPKREVGAKAFAIELPAMSAFERLLAPEKMIGELALPKTGHYQSLDPKELPTVEELMKVTICVSPEAGWDELEKFLNATDERLTVAMYQFTAPHIFSAVQDSLSPAGRSLELVLHPRPEAPAKSGVKAHEMEEQEVISQLKSTLEDRFKMSWATLVSKEHPDGLWASAYHIKVAVQDGKRVWLSSGNWQSSNQPAVHLFGDNPDPIPTGLQKKYNRDYHAIIDNEKLASAYEKFIKRDYDLTAYAGDMQPFALPDLFVPEEEPKEMVAFAAPPKLFQPLTLDRQVKVQPLLTPDNYADNALALIKSAQTSVWFQNQYINFRNNGEDFDQFQELVQALKEKIDAGVDVRIICRNLMKQENVDILLALGFPRATIRFQPACHNKTIIVDRKTVLFGSHNWSNEGVLTNRDASLIFFDEKIADYLAKVYEYDWERLATAKPSARQPRIAMEGEPTPAGFKRVPFSAVFED